MIGGDPSFAGWATTVVYLVSAGASHAAARAGQTRVSEGFWLSTAAVLMILGINKQMDVQTLVTAQARAIAAAQGFLPVRRMLQTLFVTAMAIAMTSLLALALVASRRSSVAIRVAVAGLAGLGWFVVLRAARFYHLDLAGLHTISGSPAEMIEFLSASLIGLAAAASLAGPLRARSWEQRTHRNRLFRNFLQNGREDG
jgi:hypothetical protein